MPAIELDRRLVAMHAERASKTRELVEASRVEIAQMRDTARDIHDIVRFSHVTITETITCLAFVELIEATDRYLMVASPSCEDQR
jgi:hypothetical protein